MMKKTYKSLVVDDEELARKDLKAILKKFKTIDVAHEADNLDAAIQIVKQQTFDIIFLDIQLGKDNGFDLVKHVPPDTRIIFVTAYDEYAIRAFEVNAQDYLLKPVMAERLATALENLNNATQQIENKQLSKLNPEDSIFLKLNSNYEFLKISEITHINAADDYTEINTQNGEKKLVLKSLKEWEQRLPEKQFCRIHRSTIINIDKVSRIETWFNYSYRVYLKNIEEPLIMSRRYFSLIKDKLG